MGLALDGTSAKKFVQIYFRTKRQISKPIIPDFWLTYNRIFRGYKLSTDYFS